MKYKTIEFEKNKNIFQIKETFESKKLKATLWLVRYKWDRVFDTIINLETGLVLWKFKVIDFQKIENYIILLTELRGMDYMKANSEAKEKHWEIIIY